MGYHDRGSSTPGGGNRSNRNNNRMNNNRMTNNRMNNNRQGMTNNPNPVTETFLASSGQYQYTNGLVVPPNTQLHRHRDGTVMLGHDPNQMGQQVVRVGGNDTGNQTMDGRKRGKRRRRRGPIKGRDRMKGGGNGNDIGNQTMDGRKRGKRRAVRRPRIDRNRALGGGSCGSSALMWCAILGACIAVGGYCGSNQ